jgi:Holliday junction resolvase RusA-like endonuclease
MDADAYFKSLLDACKHAGLILDDSNRYVELAPVTFARDWHNWGTVITLLDL